MADNNSNPKTETQDSLEEQQEYSEEQLEAARLHAARRREVWDGHREIVEYTMLAAFGVIGPASDEEGTEE